MQVKLDFNEHVIATDMLFETKAAIIDFSTAITESASPDVHDFYVKELRNSIQFHEQIYGYLQNNGIYDAYNIPEQLEKDIEYANQALNQ